MVVLQHSNVDHHDPQQSVLCHGCWGRIIDALHGRCVVLARTPHHQTSIDGIVFHHGASIGRRVAPLLLANSCMAVVCCFLQLASLPQRLTIIGSDCVAN